jgi:hypothetical protein
VGLETRVPINVQVRSFKVKKLFILYIVSKINDILITPAKMNGTLPYANGERRHLLNIGAMSRYYHRALMGSIK